MHLSANKCIFYPDSCKDIDKNCTIWLGLECEEKKGNLEDRKLVEYSKK